MLMAIAFMPTSRNRPGKPWKHCREPPPREEPPRSNGITTIMYYVCFCSATLETARQSPGSKDRPRHQSRLRLKQLIRALPNCPGGVSDRRVLDTSSRL